MLVMPSSENWTWGSRPDPLWNPDLEGFEGRLRQHESWESCRDNLIADGRRIHDFYFRAVDENADADGGSPAEEIFHDEFLVRSFGDKPDTGRIDVVGVIRDADHADIRAYMAEAFKSTDARLGGQLGGNGWESDTREFKKSGWFFDNIRAASFENFRNEIGEADARNLIFDVHVAPSTKGRNTVRIWMTHPGRGYGREILVEDVTNAELVLLSEMVAGHYALHCRNFGWAISNR